MLIVPHALHCADGCCFVFYLSWQSGLLFWFQCFLHLPSPPHPHPQFFSFQIWILCQNSLTWELKIRVVGFVLKKLFTRFEMLIVSHALHCVNGHYFVFYLFWQSVIMPRLKKWQGIMLYPPNFWVSVRHAVRPSVRPSAVDHSCRLHNFDTVRDNFTKLGTNIKHDQTTCRD